MRTFLPIFLLLLCAHSVWAQPYFARYYEFPEGIGNQIENMQLAGSHMLFRMSTAGSDPGSSGTRVATMPILASEFDDYAYLPDIEVGRPMVKDGDMYLLPSQETGILSHLTLNRLDENYSFIDSVHLELHNGPYYYSRPKAIVYHDKYIVTGVAQNTTGYPFSRSVIFILNKNMTLYDTLIIEPVRQLIFVRDLAINPVDGRLYLSLMYDNFLPNDSTFVPAPRYPKFATLDTSFHFSDLWNTTTEDMGGGSEFLPLAFSETGTMYSFYSHDGFDQIIAMDPSGQVSWKTPLDTFLVFGPTVLWLKSRPYWICDVAVAANGDILVAGTVDDTQFNIGRSSFLARLTSDGVIKWKRIYRANNLYSVQDYGYESVFHQVLELPNGDIAAGGYLKKLDQFMPPTGPIGPQAWVLHADSNGCISPACGFIQDVVQRTNYLPIVHPANEWTTKHDELFLHSRRKYSFSADSVFINGNYYRELKYVDSFQGPHNTGRFYREENGVVYQTSGEIVYNLDLGPTDTLPSNPAMNLGPRTVTSVGTVVYNDGVLRKSMTVQCAQDPLVPPVTVVEGIGDLEDFFHSQLLCINPLDGPSDTVLCYSVNGLIVYQKQGESCDLVSTTGPDEGTLASVYPNPATGTLYVKMPAAATESSYQVRIYSSIGDCMIHTAADCHEGLLTLEVSQLHTGNYWGLVQGRNGKYWPFKFEKIGE